MSKIKCEHRFVYSFDFKRGEDSIRCVNCSKRYYQGRYYFAFWRIVHMQKPANWNIFVDEITLKEIS